MRIQDDPSKRKGAAVGLCHAGGSARATARAAFVVLVLMCAGSDRAPVIAGDGSGNADGEGVAPTASAVPPASGPQFVGTRTCRMCHDAWHRDFEESPKGRSFTALMAGEDVESKAKAGLNPQHDYTRDAHCLACHAVGFGKPGGYAVPAVNDRQAVRDAREREGVGCESCHGPGSEFIQVMRRIRDQERPYQPAELHAAGLRRITLDDCMECHNTSAVCVSSRFASGDEIARRLRYDPHSLHGTGAHAAHPLQGRPAGYVPGPTSDGGK